MLDTFLQTLGDYIVAGIAIVAIMVLTFQGLTRLRVKREAATGITLIMPWLLGFLIWTAYPVLASLYYSFTSYNVFQPPKWVGIDNYATILTADRTFWPSLRLTLLYGAISLPIGLALSLGV